MSDKDYNSISKNLKQQIDILKTGNELTGSTACSDRPTDGPQSGPPVTRSGGEKDKLGIDTAQKVVGDTSDQTIGGIGIGSSDSRGSAVGDRSAASTFGSYEVDINIDYNKMYNIISVIYIVILILLFVNKQKIDYTIEYIIKKIY